jgi:hypothetical protein
MVPTYALTRRSKMVAHAMAGNTTHALEMTGARLEVLEYPSTSVSQYLSTLVPWRLSIRVEYLSAWVTEFQVLEYSQLARAVAEGDVLVAVDGFSTQGHDLQVACSLGRLGHTYS